VADGVLSLLTLAEAKATALRGVQGSTLDDLIQARIAAISDRIDQACGAVVNRAATEKRTGGRGIVYLRTGPASGGVLTSVTEKRFGTPTVLTAVDYELDDTGRLLYRLQGSAYTAWAAGPSAVTITYTAGRYATTATVAEPFKDACRLFLQHLWRPAEGAGSAGYGPQAGGQLSALPGYGLPNVVRDLLKRHLNPPFVG
jgi:hypothetical protein